LQDGGILPKSPVSGSPLSFAQGDLVPGSAAVDWSDTATSVLYQESLNRPGGLWPVEQARVLQAAFYAAFATHAEIVAALRPSGPYMTWAVNPEVAIGAAIHGVLCELVPAQRETIDLALERALSRIPNGDAKARGLEAGQAGARLELDFITSDGLALADVPFSPREGVGEYQLTAPGMTVRFADVAPVRLLSTKLARADQFRPPPPDDPWGARFAADLAEVRTMGASISTARSTEQDQIARFWAQPVPLAWQRLAATFWWQARLASERDGVQVLFQQFAGLQGLIYDGYVAALEAAYHYRFWRPITAIRSGLHSVDMVSDRTWEPLLPDTPPWPEYVSGDAAASVLAAWLIPGFAFESPVRNFECASVSLPGIHRSFVTLNEVVAEIGESRILAGHHFRNGVAQGLELGLRIAANPAQE
jgi:hypothetical protein